MFWSSNMLTPLRLITWMRLGLRKQMFFTCPHPTDRHLFFNKENKSDKYELINSSLHPNEYGLNLIDRKIFHKLYL